MEAILAIVGVVLAILGIIATIVFSQPVIDYLKRLRSEKRQKAKWSAQVHVEKGIIKEMREYAWDYWLEEIFVNDSGDAFHSISCKATNIGDQLVRDFLFPIYADESNIAKEELHLWAKRGSKSLKIDVIDWDSANSRGRAAILLSPVLAPGKSTVLRWGFHIPRTFSPGDDYYNWDIAAPHFKFKGVLTFSPSWRIEYARWEGALAVSQPAPTFSSNRIEACIKFPSKAFRATIKFGLSQRN